MKMNCRLNRNKVLGLLLLLVLLDGLPARAIDESEPIDTNRPSFMNSPLVLPRGSVQLENGVLFQGLKHHRWSYDNPETEVRVGLIKSTELQMYVPNAFLLHYPGMTNAKVSDLSEVGIKTHLGPDSQKFNASFVAVLNVPTGSPVVSGSGVEPVFRVPWGWNIGKWSIMGQQSLLLLNKGRNLEWVPDFMLSRTITSKAGMFIEFGGFYKQRTLPQNIIHFGGVYKITHNQQIDTQCGFGLNKAAPTAFVGVGYSFRFDQLCY